MRAFLQVVVAVFMLGSAAAAQEPRNPAIESVIEMQMSAFLNDDVAAAFEYASPSIKGIFGSSERFGLMVQRGYPMVWRPADIRFAALREIGGRLVQRVLITDAAGVIHALDYQMVKTEQGWQINGVQIVPMPQVGA